MSATAVALGLVVGASVLFVIMPVAKSEDIKRAAGATLYIPGVADLNDSQLVDVSTVNMSKYLDPKGPPVQFVLCRRDQEPFNIKLNDFKSFNDSGFDVERPTKIIIHGFLSGIREQVFTMTKDAYLLQDDYNVIGMDWSVLCEFEYFTAMRGAQLAGGALAQFIVFLNNAGVHVDDVHVIGHSLGAHVAGIGAEAIRGGQIGRITGLDPAGPGYSDVPPNLRLDPGDAQLVDVIHTYMRVLSLAQPLGHLDFYPNGGRFQPGCPDLFDIWHVPESISCNHGRAYVYLIESIMNKKAFKSRKCNSLEEAVYSRCFEESEVYMGQADTYKYGLYYVKTNLKSPFSVA